MAMDTWQDEMFDNLADHTPYIGVPYLVSDPDTAYTTTPDGIGFAVTKGSDVSEHTSMLCAKPQVNWMDAAYPKKVNWLKASKFTPDDGKTMTE